MEKTTVLVVDDDPALRAALTDTLRAAEYEVVACASGHAALLAMREQGIDVVLTDVMMPGMNGIVLLRALLDLDPDVVVILMTGQGTAEFVYSALRWGAFDYLLKPFRLATLVPMLAQAQRLRRLRVDNRRLRSLVQDHQPFAQILTANAKMQQVLQQVAQVAYTDSTVCLYGESGTGKELVAKALHLNSRRAQGPFVAINCGAIPEGLLENELFGHVKGAYTGAETGKRGLLQQAEKGTLFFDEIGELPAALQVKLLRVLQERMFYAVGAEQPTTADIRVVAATNCDLYQAVQDGTFREDLYYRLHVIPIVLPPLRARPEDIPLLALHFIRHWGEVMGKEVTGLTPEALARLVAHDWPGNVRELANVIERAVVLTTTGTLTASLLLLGRQVPTEPTTDQDSPCPSLALAREQCERVYLTRMLQETQGNILQAAKRAGVHRGHFYTLLQRYGLDAAQFKEAG